MNTHVTHFVYKESRGSRPRCRTRGVSVAASPAFSLILASVLWGLVVPAPAIAQPVPGCAGLALTTGCTVNGVPNQPCEGTAGHDIIEGTDAGDVIHGLGGDDNIRGSSGPDKICGGVGADTLDGGLHRDLMLGGEGADILIGGEGKDSLRGNGGDDELYGGAGDDNLFGNIGNDDLFGDDGEDSLNGGLPNTGMCSLNACATGDFCDGGDPATGSHIKDPKDPDSAINCEQDINA